MLELALAQDFLVGVLFQEEPKRRKSLTLLFPLGFQTQGGASANKIVSSKFDSKLVSPNDDGALDESDKEASDNLDDQKESLAIE